MGRLGEADTAPENVPFHPALLGAPTLTSQPSAWLSARGARGDRGCLGRKGGGSCWKTRGVLDRSAEGSNERAVCSRRQRGGSGVAEGVNGSGDRRAPSPAANTSCCCWRDLITTGPAAPPAGGCAAPGMGMAMAGLRGWGSGAPCCGWRGPGAGPRPPPPLARRAAKPTGGRHLEAAAGHAATAAPHLRPAAPSAPLPLRGGGPAAGPGPDAGGSG